MASDANTGNATFLGSLVWCSSEVAMGLPTKTRLSTEYMSRAWWHTTRPPERVPGGALSAHG